uniref:Uncharacterized protein n=1 Tax=Balaenoptera musculus TaxID=9771 RepID=A0A8C0DPI6_BALMU
ITGFLLPSISRGTRRSCSRSRKRQMRMKNPSNFMSNPLALLLYAWSQSHHARVSSCSAHRSQHSIPFALSLQQVSFVLPSLQVVSLYLGQSWG